MKRWAWMGALAAVVGLGGFVAVTGADSRRVATVASTTAPATVILPDFRVIAKRAIPAVVTVRSEKEMNHPEVNDGPMGDLFGRFFGRPRGGEGQGAERRGPSYTQRGLGSGVIVSSDGYVITNNHVVEGVDKIEVVTASGEVLTGRLVGADAKSDIAVLKVEAKTSLTAMPFGNSDALEVGEWVLAVGNPFSERLGHTVTAGIVSATGRSQLDIADYEDFIQTDAAVNPGNSGGALVNTQGQLIGINTAIVSRSGGSQGVSFAVPINMARHVMDQLVSTGRVARGYLGVGIQDIDRDLAESLSLSGTDGVLVREVYPDTPAVRAGMRRGDVIVSLDGQTVKDVSELRNRVARLSPGSAAKVEVLREGKNLRLDLRIAELDDKALSGGGSTPAEAPSPDQLGLTVQPLTHDLGRRLGYEGSEGVVVAAVESGSVAERAGMTPGDLVMEVNRKPVASPAEFARMVAAVEKGGVCLLYVRRGDNSMFVTVRR